MNKNYLLVSVCFIFNITKIFSQCTIAIPSNAVVINNDTTIGMVNQIFWVCGGNTLNGSGVHNTYFVESGGALDMSGIEKIVYLKSGASINCSGIDDTIYYESGAIISCSGNHVDTLCNSIVFDYSNAPQNGCITTDIFIQTIEEENKVKIFPNPFSENAIIEFYLKERATGKVIINDLTGKVIKALREQYFVKGKNQFVLSRDNLTNGIYYCELRINNISQRVKLIIL